MERVRVERGGESREREKMSHSSHNIEGDEGI